MASKSLMKEMIGPGHIETIHLPERIEANYLCQYLRTHGDFAIATAGIGGQTTMEREVHPFKVKKSILNERGIQEGDWFQLDHVRGEEDNPIRYTKVEDPKDWMGMDAEIFARFVA